MKQLLIKPIEFVEAIVSMTFMLLLITLFIMMSALSEIKSSIHFTDKVRKRVVRRTSHAFYKSMRERFHP